jgi:hypothetical protein
MKRDGVQCAWVWRLHLIRQEKHSAVATRLPCQLTSLPCIRQSIQVVILSPHGVHAHKQRAKRSTQETMNCMQIRAQCARSAAFMKFHSADGPVSQPGGSKNREFCPCSQNELCYEGKTENFRLPAQYGMVCVS